MIPTGNPRVRATFFCGVAFIATWGLAGLAQMPQWPDDGYYTDSHHQVTRVETGGPAEAAGLQLGDRIITIQGAPSEELPATPRRAQPNIGDSHALEIEREGRSLTVELTYAPYPRSFRLPRILGGVVALSFLGAATWVFVTVPTSAGVLFSLFGLSAAFSMNEGPFVGVLEGFAGLAEVTVGVLWIILLLHLFLVFPRPKEILARRHIQMLLYGPILLFVALGIVELALDPRFYHAFAMATLGWVLVYLVLALWAFGHGWFRVGRGKRWDSGLGLILVGVAVAAAPQLLRLATFAIAPSSPLPGAEFYPLFSAAIPVSLALAMRKHAQWSRAPREPQLPCRG